VERAEEEGERVRKQAQIIAEHEVKKARAALKKEMVDLSLELAENLLREAIQPQDQERLVREYIKMKEIGDQLNRRAEICQGPAGIACKRRITKSWEGSERLPTFQETRSSG
jgi:hypothetical protein